MAVRARRYAALPTSRPKPVVTIAGDVITLRLPRELKTPNKTLWAHWRKKSAERKAWIEAVTLAILDTVGAREAMRMLSAVSGLPNAGAGMLGCMCEDRCACLPNRKRRVTIVRHVPTARHIIRDDDNLMFATKHLVDALKALGLIRDDDRKWAERPLPTQQLSGDGIWWTEVRIEPVEGA